MPYTYDAKEANSYGLLEEGEYEVSIEKMETKTLPSGAEKLALTLRVRTDVEQDFQNRILFEDIWKERDTPYFNRKRLNQLMSTQEFKDGTVFNNIYEIIDELVGGKLRVKVTKSMDDYRNEEVNRIAYYKKTEFPTQRLGEEAKEEPKAEAKQEAPAEGAKAGGPNEDDLPF